jgi:sugar/nucleoside kinase (ribokinase family)
MRAQPGKESSVAAKPNVDVMIIGHLARDELIVDGVSRVSRGGAVYYGSLALHRLGLTVAVATRLHPDDFYLLDELRQEGVLVHARPGPETSGIANYYDSADMERRICRPLGFAGGFQPEDIPEWSARLYLIGPIIAGEVDLPLLKSLSGRGPVALDVQGFVRVRQGDSLVFRQWDEMEEGLAQVTYLKADRAEAELLTGQTDLRHAARMLADYGPREVIITQSSGVTVLAGGRFYTAPFTPRSLDGRTGRGDTCFATYIGKRLSTTPAEACRVAGAITTLKQERPGPWNGDLAELEALLENR